MYGDPDRPQYGDYLIVRRPADKRRHAPLVVFTLFGLALIGGAIFFTIFISPEAGVTVLSIFRIAFFTFLGVYALFGFFATYHMVRFGWRGDMSLPTTLLFLAASVILGAIGVVVALLPVTA